MAYRGGIALQGIEAGFNIEAAEAKNLGFGIRETVQITGSFSETELLRLRRAVDFCPVGQIFTKGAMEIEDQVEWVAVDESVSYPRGASRATSQIPEFAPGTIQGQHLPETMEFADGKVAQDGEVKLSVACKIPDRGGNWMLFAGHVPDARMPPPVPLTMGGLAASAVATLRTVESLREGPLSRFRVELGTNPNASGNVANREENQIAAGEGRLRSRPTVRRVVLQGTPSPEVERAVRNALQNDPLTKCFRNGDALLGEEVLVV